MRIVPILFSADMVRALLEERKSVTRRIVRFREGWNPKWTGYVPEGPVLYGSNNIPAAKCQYRPGDILYIRETWAQGVIDSTDFEGRCNESFFEPHTPPTVFGKYYDECIRYFYRTDFSQEEEREVQMVWRPSIHMPKEAARIFLEVKSTRAETLQDITEDDAVAEGILPKGGNFAIDDFESLWDRTVKPADRDKYAWNANPWVWVIEFERVDKPAGWPGEAGK